MKKVQISLKKFVKITKIKFHKMLAIRSDLLKTCLKIYYFCQHSKKAKNGQMAKPFYFWQTVSKKAKWQPRSLFRLILDPLLFLRGNFVANTYHFSSVEF
jgi:hypothetical protein